MTASPEAAEPYALKASGFLTVLTIDDVRQRVPVSRRTIYAWIGEGSFPKPHKIKGKGNRVFFEPQAVGEWLKANPGAGA